MLRLVLVLFLTAAVARAELTGRVIRVSDGDTITILVSGNQQVRIRLAWIDAPELGQAFGNVSRQALAELVAGKTVQVEEHDIDRYSRIVGTVFVDGQDVCLAQVQAGLAWVYDHYVVNAPLAVQSQYYKAQEESRRARRGLWLDNNPLEPWTFRRTERELKK
jgi:endonuclease YncB( thermonuclease family)